MVLSHSVIWIRISQAQDKVSLISFDFVAFKRSGALDFLLLFKRIFVTDGFLISRKGKPSHVDFGRKTIYDLLVRRDEGDLILPAHAEIGNPVPKQLEGASLQG